MSARSPLSVVFLLHIALEIPLAIQGVWSPTSLPFVQLNNTTLVVLKLYSALVFAICGVALLCYSLPEFLPGKRALAIGLCIYHTICSTILYQAPRFIPMSFGAVFEASVVSVSLFPSLLSMCAHRYKITPEAVWGTLHGLVGLSMVFWWQGTVHYAQLVRGAPQ
ncbi:hypothetical protein DFH08DRAFT_408223 [Mycena albidolilacea]|uniref:Uncharacterized protein n=1 Tax=Mycena albidolilacea TaxID=1033008 RepID=A0AAD7EZX0_9AGAR|nr:hypothetical protein DFH08DRAFT_408223 [Mycena albidolilacea]